MDRSRLWRVYLLGGGVAVGVFLLLPYGVPRDALYALIGLSSAVAAFTAAVHSGGVAGRWTIRRATRRAWVLMGLGQLMAVCGDLMWLHYTHIARTDPFPSLADLFYLLEYPLVTAALTLLVLNRRSHFDREALLDSAILIVGLALPYWVLLIQPSIGGYESAFDQTVALGYPVADVALLAVLMWLLNTSYTQTRAFRLLTAALVMLLTADVIFIVTEGEPILDLPLGDLPFLGSY
ncbi:hypothetical protein, partial [Planobispora rosea]